MFACLLPLIAGVCLASPSQLSVEGDASFQVSGAVTYQLGADHYGPGIIGRAALQMDVPLYRSFTFRYGIEHTSLLDTNNDRGQERAFIGFLWHPFGRAP